MFYFLAVFVEQYSFLEMFRYLTLRSGAAMITSFGFLLCLEPFVLPMLRAWQGRGQPIRLDGPQGHLSTKQGTPTMGGLLIIASFLLSVLLWVDLRNSYVLWILLVTLGFGFIGFCDDYIKVKNFADRGISGKWRLSLETVVAFVAVLGFISAGSALSSWSLAIPAFSDLSIPLSWFFPVFAVLVIVGAGNAVNLTDGLDGLASVPVAITAAVFGLIAYAVSSLPFSTYLDILYVPGIGEISVVCGALVGSVLGFLWFNAHPAKIFMGDTGSLALGGTLGAVAVAARHELVLGIVGMIFVLETLSVIIQVASFKLRGKRVFLMAPLHHHFEKKGWSEPKIVVRFWIISALLAVVSLATLKLR